MKRRERRWRLQVAEGEGALSLLRQVHTELAAWTSRVLCLESHKAEIRVFLLETLVVTAASIQSL